MSVTPSDPSAIRDMFARVARRYDLNNRLFSFGRDRSWRRAAVRAAGPCGGLRVLDAACGTGDLAGLFARAGAARVVGADFCEEMLARARRRFAGERIEWLRADAMNLPSAAGEFDVVSCAFGIRNMADPRRALTEFARVLAPGGRCVILEFHRQRARGVFGRLVRLYTDRIMPPLASAVARDGVGAYRYLSRSSADFMSPEELDEAMRQAGLAQVSSRWLTLRLVALHVGVRA